MADEDDMSGAERLLARVQDAEPSSTIVDASTAATDTPKPRVRMRRCREVVGDIHARKDEQWFKLALDGEQLAEVRPGGIVLLIGGSGRGKTSLAATLAVEHAINHGPALSFSLELPSDEWTARAIGTRCDASWPDVLRGRVALDEMKKALPDRLFIIERRDATFAALATALSEIRALHPGEPILVAVDYVQIMHSEEREIRRRVADVMEQLDAVAREHLVVMIALSQGSRVSARALSSGEKIGAETTDSGAEAAELERWSTMTIAIGAIGEPAEDGSAASDLSIGKGRMTGGDAVRPARFWGRSGLWRFSGEARKAADVRAERKSVSDSTKATAARLAIVGALDASKAPMSVSQVRQSLGIGRDLAFAVVKALRDEGLVVHVRGKKSGGVWPVWTPNQAAANGIDVVPEGA